MEPKHERLDHLALLVEMLQAQTDHLVVSELSAEMDMTHSPVTVVQVPTIVPAGSLTRWNFNVDVTLTTFAATTTAAYESHKQPAGAILEVTGLQGRVRVSSTRCTLEPVNLPRQTAPQWPGVVSTYNLFMRGENNA